MNPMKIAVGVAAIAGAGAACIAMSQDPAATITSSIRPRGDLCSPTYAAERYTAEHESGADVQCEDEQ